MINLRTTISTLAFMAIIFSYAQDNISLAGKWEFATINNVVGPNELTGKDNATTSLSPKIKFDDTILLPASMPERDKGDEVTAETQWVGSLYDSSYYFNPYMKKYREPGNVKFPFFLTPNRHYVGKAWYRRKVDIPSTWADRHITLLLERPHIVSTLWVNGKLVGSEESLSVPHCYDITSYVNVGSNEILIEVDNDPDKVGVGQDSHSVTDQTQGDWNGIVGRMELQSTPAMYIEHIDVFPKIGEQNAEIVVKIGQSNLSNQNNQTVRKNRNNQKKTIATQPIRIHVELFNSDKQQRIDTLIQFSPKRPDDNGMTFTATIHGLTELWDEFTPSLYRLQASLDNGATSTTTFGMREISINGRQILVNGKRTMLRGTVENCCFPNTGYPPTDKAEWERVFRICKQYGLNHVRFHSYCPPEAAFEAADIVGIYLQPEGPSWPNHGVSLGRGEKIDTYLMDETKKMTESYGNHPSFTMLCAGNEPRGNWVAWVSDFVDYWKQTDSRRIYTGASVGGGWQWQPHNQYHVKAGARGLDWGKRPQSMDDFTAGITSFYDKATRTTYDINEPFVTHECGQWCAFPDFEEISQYTGVNHAKNFEIFRDILADNDMSDMARKFLISSGKLQALCYKYEMERIFRTPDYAGFQLLSLNDYSGQGTALVGVLNVFFREKGYCNANDFTEFCSELVPLARFPKFTFKNTENAIVGIAISNYTGQELKGKNATYRITHEDGSIERQGEVGGGKDIAVGYNEIGDIPLPLSDIKKAEKMTLTVTMDGHHNHWDFWVYPDKQEEKSSEDGIYITDTLDAKALKVLKKGGKVLIASPGKISYGKDVVQHYLPVFWNTSWFKMRPPHTTGAYIDRQHPIFRDFPTDDFSNLNWWELLHNAQVMQLTDFPKGFHPIVQSIDTWFVSRKIGMLLEANVLKGKVVMTSMDITSDLDRRIVARQLRQSIINYMQSKDFQPVFTVEPERLTDLFTKQAPPVDMFTKDSPDELKPKIN